MKNSALIATISLFIAIPLVHAGEELAMLDNSQAIAYAQFTTHKAKPTKSLRTYLVKSRNKHTQQDFDAMMLKNHPENYNMLSSLSPDVKLAIYSEYKRGDRVKTLRKQVITEYSYSITP